MIYEVCIIIRSYYLRIRNIKSALLKQVNPRNSRSSRKEIFPKNTIIYLMPEERSVDIDNTLDFKIVEMLLKKNKYRI